MTVAMESSSDTSGGVVQTSEAISSDKELGKSIALITDGRFSGASTGPVIRFLGENPGACPWDEAKKYFSKSLMSISSEYTLQS